MFDATILFYILFLLNCSLGEGNFILYFITIKLFAWKHTNVISFFFLREAKEPRVSVPPKCHHVNGSSSALSVIGTIVSGDTESKNLSTTRHDFGVAWSIRFDPNAISRFIHFPSFTAEKATKRLPFIFYSNRDSPVGPPLSLYP